MLAVETLPSFHGAGRPHLGFTEEECHSPKLPIRGLYKGIHRKETKDTRKLHTDCKGYEGIGRIEKSLLCKKV